jgi:hypothetical protein
MQLLFKPRKSRENFSSKFKVNSYLGYCNDLIGKDSARIFLGLIDIPS